MADVTGSIGNEVVELNNASTEATLRALLAATLAANKQSISSINSIATKAGLDPASVQAANENLDTLGKTSGSTKGLMYGLGFAVGAAEKGLGGVARVLGSMTDLIQGGSKNISDFGAALSGLPFGIGIVMGVLGKLAKVQEAEFESYQKLSNAGSTFGGSLLGLRNTAYNLKMNMAELGNVYSQHGETFAKLGGSVEQGRKSFGKVAGEMMNNGVGDKLRALGYTSEQAVGGMANYLSATGGRTKKEMENTAGIIAGTQDYLHNLDSLTQLTGKNRDELEKEMKAAAQNAAFEAMVAGMTDENEKKKAMLGLQNASMIKGGADAFMSKMLGVPPMTEAARSLQALAPNMTANIHKQADAVRDSTKTTQDLDRLKLQSVIENQKDVKRLGKTVDFMAFGSDANSQAAISMRKLATTSEKQGLKTEADIDKNLKVTAEDRAAREKNVAVMVAQENEMISLQQELRNMLDPLIMEAGPLLIKIIRGIIEVGKFLWEYKEIVAALIVAGAALVLLQKLQAKGEVFKSARAQGRGVLGSLGQAVGVGVGALGSSPQNAMWVRVVGGGVLGGRGQPGGSGPAGGGGRGGGGGGRGGGSSPAGGGGRGGAGIGSKVAEGLGGLGKGLQGMLSGLGKGAGQLIKSILSGLAGGLSSLGKPQVMLGAVTLGLLAGVLYIASEGLQNFAKISWEDMGKGFVTLLGLGALAAVLGIAAPVILVGSVAIGAMGLSLVPFALGIGAVSLVLPIFTKNLSKIAEINGDTLGSLGVGVGKMGVGLALWAPFAVFGIPAAFALSQMADSFTKLSNIDTEKLLKVAAAMEKVKDSSPGIGTAIGAGVTALIGKVTGSNASTTTTPTSPTGSSAGTADLNILVTEIRSLNNGTKEMIIQLKEISNQTKLGVSATKGLNGNLFKF